MDADEKWQSAKREAKPAGSEQRAESSKHKEIESIIKN